EYAASSRPRRRRPRCRRAFRPGRRDARHSLGTGVVARRSLHIVDKPSPWLSSLPRIIAGRQVDRCQPEGEGVASTANAGCQPLVAAPAEPPWTRSSQVADAALSRLFLHPHREYRLFLAGKENDGGFFADFRGLSSFLLLVAG